MYIQDDESANDYKSYENGIGNLRTAHSYDRCTNSFNFDESSGNMFT